MSQRKMIDFLKKHKLKIGSVCIAFAFVVAIILVILTIVVYFSVNKNDKTEEDTEAEITLKDAEKPRKVYSADTESPKKDKKVSNKSSMPSVKISQGKAYSSNYAYGQTYSSNYAYGKGFEGFDYKFNSISLIETFEHEDDKKKNITEDIELELEQEQTTKPLQDKDQQDDKQVEPVAVDNDAFCFGSFCMNDENTEEFTQKDTINEALKIKY